MNFEIDKETFEEISKVIHSDSSPVGIDAKKTHILILKKLNDIEQQMNRIEDRLDRLENK